MVLLFVAGALSGVAFLRLLRLRRRLDEEKLRGLAATPAAPAAHANTSVIGAADAGNVVDHNPVSRLQDLFPSDSPNFPSPLLTRVYPKNQNFVGEEESLGVQCLYPHASRAPATSIASWLVAGPSERLYWDPQTVRVAIVTCGGLCSGLNTVIQSTVMCLSFVYGVPEGNVFGVLNGYRGFYETPFRRLTPRDVSNIHTAGGTILGSSRGGFDADRILASVVQHNINIVIIVGGDGTHRGAMKLTSEAVARRIQLSVACIPKTIDNDIAFIDKSFGFDTAVQQAVHPLTCAHTEALAAKNGVGLVKLMGRSSGFIAMFAALASRDVNICLIPEAPWRLSSLLEYLEARLASRGHCLIAVAEGAECIEQKEVRSTKSHNKIRIVLPPQTPTHEDSGTCKDTPTPLPATADHTDESGNAVLDDIGVWLKDKIAAHFKKRGLPLNLKYIDPSYVIRASAPIASDSHLCGSLAFNAVHGAMAGRTGFSAGVINGVGVMIPIAMIAHSPTRTVDTTGRLYARMCNTTGQPSLF